MGEIYREYTDLVEPFGIDESWLDVTGTLHLFGGDPRALADRLRDRLRSQFGLTISVGVSFNKVFAKLGSDYKKPDATTVITRENFQQLLWPLPVTDLLFVGCLLYTSCPRKENGTMFVDKQVPPVSFTGYGACHSHPIVPSAT